MNETPALQATRSGSATARTGRFTTAIWRSHAGSVTALVGPNGAGKTTLLQLAVGLIEPTSGTISVLGHGPRTEPLAVLPRVGFVAQDHPLPRRFTIGETLRARPGAEPELGRRGRRGADRRARPFAPATGRNALGRPAGTGRAHAGAGEAAAGAAARRAGRVARPAGAAGVPHRRAAGGDRDRITVVLSSHIVADLERICDRLIILANGRTQLVGPIEDILAGHRLLTGPRTDAAAVARMHEVIRESHTERQTTLLVRANGHVYDAAGRCTRSTSRRSCSPISA